MLFYSIIFVITAVDQMSKYWIRNVLKVGESMPFYKDFISFTYYQNSGAAGSSLQGWAPLLGLLAVLIVAGIWWYRRKGGLQGTMKEIAAALLVGGAIGNGIERLLFGKVTDFIVIHSGNGVMNLADMAINLGVVLYVVDMLLSQRVNWKRKGRKVQI
ncbi:signal peptidase II [Paenibacillus pectinilyticus]|uniref:Lipoprotein signal peptidase n=1 Tax=Paenibacillus pectinilyticus TaxID=512399 RepID=A0A1C1A2Q8_9BACL|nr:signal peptidase II [Paenibacillus pectinilyticus]OCT14808.1 signal peptidase II [Paenibacillus pectinilyticus]